MAGMDPDYHFSHSHTHNIIHVTATCHNQFLAGLYPIIAIGEPFKIKEKSKSGDENPIGSIRFERFLAVTGLDLSARVCELRRNRIPFMHEMSVEDQIYQGESLQNLRGANA
ncbi:MAG TPA: hypothetical protein PLA02_08805 [Brevefilum fermentans]|jgi:hypothetical protein|nr:hypothetical protein [Brevefilum fermentans]